MRTTPAITYSRHTTIVCRHHTSYIRSTLHTPIHCSCCTSSKLRIDSTSELDEFAIKYNLHPKAAIEVYKLASRHNAGHYSTSVSHSDYKHSMLLNEFAEAILKLTPSPITPLNLHCNSCGSTYTLIRTTPTTQKTPPLHCVYCTSLNIGLIQADPEQTAFISLALHYELPLTTLKALYNFWTQRPNYKTFNEFMTSDTYAQIRPILEASMEVTT